MSAGRIFTLLIVGTTALLAHAGEPLQPHDLWSAWRFDPGVIIPLFVSAFLYIRGIRSRREGPAFAEKSASLQGSSPSSSLWYLRCIRLARCSSPLTWRSMKCSCCYRLR